MMIVGLTGGIGSGKTTVAAMFADLGVAVYDSDSEAKDLMNRPGKLKDALIDLLGEDAYREGSLNRPYISERIFNDAELLQRMNALVHPEVKTHFDHWASSQLSAYLIQEAAVLFENGSYKNFDRMILVKAPEAMRIARLKARDGSSEKEIRARMKNQWDDTRKSQLADFVIENITLEKTRAEVLKIHGQLLEISA